MSQSMQQMLLTIFLSSMLAKMRAGKHDEVIADLEDGLKALDEDEENGD